MRKVSSYIAYFSLFVGLTLLIKSLCIAQSQTFSLSGVVMRESGTVKQGVEVNLKGDGVNQTTFTDKDGQFNFEVPAGKYELIFRSSEYYETVLKDVEIRKQPLNSLKIILPRLTFERDLEIIGPKLVPAPALEASFEPDSRPVPGRPVTGTLLLKNVGMEPVVVPTTLFTEELWLKKREQYAQQGKSMHVSVFLEGYSAFYDETYVCLPSKDCRELKPSEVVSFPITIYHRQDYFQGKRVSQVYPQPGEYKLKLSVQFMLPSGPNEDIRTEAIRKEVKVVVCNCP